MTAETTDGTLKGQVMVVKAEGAAGAIASNALEIDDEFKGVYGKAAFTGGHTVIEPPYNFYSLEKIAQENNALLPCIDAMETNIDGTGWEIEREDNQQVAENDPTHQALSDFFKTPYPGKSFVTVRRDLRRDLETIGNGYLEVMRAVDGSIAFVRNAEGKLVRMLELDDPVPVTKAVMRGGKEVAFTVMVRERRFAMKTTGDANVVFFKEFGASRDLDKLTGKWAAPGERLPPERRATELLHFVNRRDIRTPYGVPRWVNQTPSVVGSRKAEEHNLSFFESGGIPPMLIMVQGGSFAPETRTALDQSLNGRAANKHRAVVMEAYSTEGSLDKSGTVRVTVERFGAERMSDSMFEKYDERCEQRVRRAFRLPPLFVGQAVDYNFATAQASYMVAEAQVFAPERREFDEIINAQLIPAIGGKGYQFRSKALSVKDVEQQLKALGMAKDANAIDGEQLVQHLNETTNLSMKHSPDPLIEQQKQNTALPKEPANDQALARADRQRLAKDEVGTMIPEGLIELARAMVTAVRKNDLARIGELTLETARLSPAEGETLRRLMSTFTYADPSVDPDGLGELAGCTMAVLAAARTH